MKKWYLSKTLWVNVIALIAIIAQLVSGREIISQEAQGLFLTGINIILRIVTKHELIF
jgi:Mg2+/citrate symporter